MSNVRRLRDAVRMVTTVGAALALIGAYTIAFAEGCAPNAASAPHSSIAFGR
jgi:hypothetical protein